MYQEGKGQQQNCEEKKKVLYKEPGHRQIKRDGKRKASFEKKKK